MPKAAPSLDMTPMVDLAFLLVTFFMLTAAVRVSEPAVVDPPSSASDKLLPKNVIMVSVDPNGRAFFNVDNPEVRIKVLDRMAAQYKAAFDDKDRKKFGGMASFGAPMAILREYINKDDNQRQQMKNTGIPYDSLHNELKNWIDFGRFESLTYTKTQKEKAKSLGREFKVEPLRYAIKCDGKTNFILVKQILKTFTDLDIYQFNLITNLEQESDAATTTKP